MGTDEETGSVNERTRQVWKGLCAGALSGLSSRFFVYPFDTVKAQLQLQGGLQSAGAARQSMFPVMLQIAQNEGLLGFYRGFSVILAGVVPANMAYFGGYELGKAMVPPDSGIVGNMATGAIAQMIAGVVFNPIDIIKERMQVQRMMAGTYNYSSALHATRDLLLKDGPAGLLRGYWVTNSVWIPWNIMYISGYEAAKQAVARDICKVDSPSELPAWAISSCAGGSAAVAAIVTNPMDVVKLRLQVLTAGNQQVTSSQLLKELWLREGWRGLFAGTGARVMSIAPGSAISWMLYEKIMKLL